MSAEDPAEPAAATDKFLCPCCGKDLTDEANRWKASQMGKKGGAVNLTTAMIYPPYDYSASLPTAQGPI